MVKSSASLSNLQKRRRIGYVTVIVELKERFEIDDSSYIDYETEGF